MRVCCWLARFSLTAAPLPQPHRDTKHTHTHTNNSSRSEFIEDPRLDPALRAKLDDFWDSGYDRGHLVPAANHKGSQKAMDDTFTLT